ncbi:hypothetical protein Cni_G10305 [Canna indica]|uniref:Reverse transcriptase zinc-binding domain-containing protein n=1 Tax=Canna indica TaxID=4628 RepID=A0AAQ3QA73_9LILI|nr:hypothetical protein Cni_G10305 [Canna indica]
MLLISLVPRAVLCGSLLEDINHIFLECEVAMTLWEMMDARFAGVASFARNFCVNKDASFNDRGNTPSILFALCFNTLYSIWTARNKAVFEHLRPSNYIIFAKILALTMDYADISISEGNKKYKHSGFI